MTNQLASVDLSIVIPCYNEANNLAPLFARLLPVLKDTGLAYEIVCVNDGSRDDTLNRLIALRADEPRLRVVDLSRNFGKERALSAGLAHSRGRAVVPMDADLQQPPEAIPEMLAKWRDGYEMVYAMRHARVGQSLLSKIFAKTFYWVFDHMTEIPIPHEVGDFRLMDRKVVNAINRMPERSRFMKGIFAWVGFRQTGIIYKQEERTEGGTKWGYFRLFRFALDGLTAFSNFPLRVWSVVGAIISGLAFIYILIRLFRVWVYGIDVPGYESTLVTVLFLGGIQLLTLGIIGDYLGRVFEEAKGRPLYIVREIYEEQDPNRDGK